MSPETLALLTELVKAVFFGISIVCIPLATVYTMIAAARAKRAETATALVSHQIDGLLTDRDEAKKKEGAALADIASDREAALLARGQKEGRDNERARWVQTQQGPQQTLEGVKEKAPVAVADERTAEASERVAAATERAADATERATDSKK